MSTVRVVQGDRLLRAAVSFGRELRTAGVSADLAAAMDFARALTIVEIAEREHVREAGATCFVRRRDDRETYDRVFRRFWRRRPLDGEPTMEAPTALADERDRPPRGTAERGSTSHRPRPARPPVRPRRALTPTLRTRTRWTR